MADFRARQRVAIHDGTNEFGVTNTTALWVKLTDGSNTTIINTNGSLNVEFSGGIEINTITADAFPVEVNTITADSQLGTSIDTITASGIVNVNLNTNTATTPGLVDVNTITADGQIPTSLDTVTASGILNVNNNTNTAQTPGLVDLNTVTASGNLGTSLNTVTATSPLLINLNTNTAGTPGLVNINTVTTTLPFQVSRTNATNSETNPLFVQVVTGVVSGIEVNAYTTTSALAKDGTANHDYSVTAGSVFMLKSFVMAASGAQKGQLQRGAAASLTTEDVVFTSGAKPTEQIFYDPPLECTGTCRLILRNDDNQAMDVYSSFKGVIV